MKNLLYFIINLLDNNRGYETQTQKRFKKGDIAKITRLKEENNPFFVGTDVTILETGRHDYLVKGYNGEKTIVYQYELKK